MKPLYKTTIVIWSKFDPASETFGRQETIEDLARDAVSGESYCSGQHSVLIENPSKDKDWDGTEFFDDGHEED